MAIHTVLGPIDAAELGPTSMHEHLLSDLRMWTDRPGRSAPIGPELQAELRWNAKAYPENAVLHDARTAADELRGVRSAGGSAVVDLTAIGMGRRVGDLPAISRASGVHICVGCGYYIDVTHPEQIHDADVDTLAELMIAELRDGIEGTGIRPALIGEIGTGDPITPREWRVVRAAAHAGVVTGAAVNVHVHIGSTNAIAIAAALIDEGLPADRVILSHMDEQLDRAYQHDAAQTGAILEYDTFGQDFYYGSPRRRDSTDHERLEMAVWLLSEGYGGQLVLGCDVWTRSSLHRNGGFGYDHLLRRIRPALQDMAGADEKTMDQVFIGTPRRLLDRP